MTNTTTPSPATASDMTPEKALKTIRTLADLLHSQRTQRNARRRELVDAMGSEDIGSILSKEPERASEITTEIMHIKMQYELAEIAAESAASRIRELAARALPAVLAPWEELKTLHAETRSLVIDRVRASLSKSLLESLPPGLLHLLIHQSQEVREQNAFEAAYPASMSVPLAAILTGPDRNVVVDIPHEDAYANPSVFAENFDRLTMGVAAARERLAKLKAEGKRFFAAPTSEVEQLRTENARLKTLLAARR